MSDTDISFWRAIKCLFTTGHDFEYLRSRKVTIVHRCRRCGWVRYRIYPRHH